MNASLQKPDWIVPGGLFAILLGIARWVMPQKSKTAADYFLEGRNLNWFVTGASVNVFNRISIQ